MVADGLVMQGAKASAAVILTQLSLNILILWVKLTETFVMANIFKFMSGNYLEIGLFMELIIWAQ